PSLLAQGNTGEVRADLLAEACHLVAQLVSRARREPHLHVRHALRAEPVDPVDDAVVAVHREPRQLPIGLPDVHPRVVADFGDGPWAYLVALAQDVGDVVSEAVGRRRLRDPPVADARDAA